MLLDKLWSLNNDAISEVLFYNKTQNKHQSKKIYRKYKCYGETPNFNSKIKKSYMFCDKTLKLPEALNFYVEQFKTIDKRYNQFVVNWYESDDYIEPHSDCTSAMIQDYNIGLIVIGEDRPIIFTSRLDPNIKLMKQTNGGVLEISKELNELYRHEVGPGSFRRISITARMMRVGNEE